MTIELICVEISLLFHSEKFQLSSMNQILDVDNHILGTSPP